MLVSIAWASLNHRGPMAAGAEGSTVHARARRQGSLHGEISVPSQLAARVWYRAGTRAPGSAPHRPCGRFNRSSPRRLHLRRACWEPTVCFLNESHAISASVDGYPRWRASGAINCITSTTERHQCGPRAAWDHVWIERWICENGGAGVGWEPYPLSRRVVDWIRFLLRGGGSELAISEVLQRGALAHAAARMALGRQPPHRQRAGTDFRRGVLPGLRGDKWPARGRALLSGQLQEQILPNGGQMSGVRCISARAGGSA